MHEGKFVFSQITELISRFKFQECVEKYAGNKGVRGFTCWQQFLCLSFGQLTQRSSLRNIVTCLNSVESRLYHLGFQGRVSRSTLAESSERRDWRIYHDLAQILIREARELYRNDNDFDLEIDGSIYALDSSTIDLCLNIFRWAPFREHKAAIKLHTLLDVKTNIPTFIEITDGKVHDVNILDQLEFEPGAFYIMDRGYLDFTRLYKIHVTSAFFVTRAKTNTKWQRIYSHQVEQQAGVMCDQTIRLTGSYANQDYPEKLRRVKYFDAEEDRYYVFLTNNFTLEAKQITELYRHRWRIEIFFKWVKQHLEIKSFWGRSQNAVQTQVWIAICTYVLVAILKKKLRIPDSLYDILQILSTAPFEKTPLKQLFDANQVQSNQLDSMKQLKLLNI